MILTPRDRQRLAFPLLAILPLPPPETSTKKANIGELLRDAANRAASYIERLDMRAVRPDRDAVERFREALDGALPAEPSRAADILAFLDEHGSPATVASAGGRYFGFVTG